jgi:acyl dehydratase
MGEFGDGEVFAKRRFSEVDQYEFVRMTGDANPVHADAEAAPRMFTGGLIVHGVHGLMWSLDTYLMQNPDAQIRYVHAAFLKPIRLNEDVVGWASRTSDGLKLKLKVRGVDATICKIAFGAAPKPTSITLTDTVHMPPTVCGLNDLGGVSGVLVMAVAARDLVRAFPSLVDAVGPTAVVGFGSLATLVGMKCPGLYGISTDISVDLSLDSGPLTYKVKRIDRRFARAEIAVMGYGISGEVGAFVNEPNTD